MDAHDELITMRPIAFVHSPRAELRDSFWGGLVSVIELVPELPVESLDGIETYSHAEVIFVFDRIGPAEAVSWTRHPRENPTWPRVGVFAQRARHRPNRLGTTIVRVRRRDRRQLEVDGLDAVDGTPVLDIKPVISEFLPGEPVRQPEWVRESMRDYWAKAPS